MKIISFRGGIHPPYNKHLTSSSRIIEVPAPDMLYIPLQQHIGAPCDALVQKGDYVKVGQKIGDSGAFVSSPVHSSVSGTVVSVEKHLHPNGTMVNTVVIENDHQDMMCDTLEKNDYENMSSEEIINAIHSAGIVGLGGAGFPMHIKLSPVKGKQAEYVIINGAECEPYLSSDHRSMIKYTDEIIYGLKAVMKAVGAKKGIIAIENNKRDAEQILTELTVDIPEIEIALMETKYPQGSEKHIIKAVLGREVPSGGLPLDVGVIVNNIDTCIAVAGAIKEGIPVIKRRITVSGYGMKHPGVFEARIGTLFSEIIEIAGGMNAGVKKILMGGPMMGTAQFDLNVPVIKTTSGILALTREEIRPIEEYPCLRCGKCVDVCPMNLVPLKLAKAGIKGDDDAAVAFHANDCIECGCCSYICPSRRPLTESIRIAKGRVVALLANARK